MRYSLCVVLVLAAAGCGTVQSTFGSVRPDYTAVPEASLRALARDIEAAVASGDRNVSITPQPGVKAESDTVVQAIRSRVARHDLLDEFRNSGHVWEKRDGLIWILRTREYRRAGTSRDRDRDALLINGENQNRWTLYEGLIKENQWQPRVLSTIQLIFHEARLEFMSPGQQYETVNGGRAAVGAR